MIDETAIERELRAAARSDQHPLPDLGEAAATAGLLDVAYATLDSPLGTLLLARTDRGLVRLAYIDFEGEDEVVAELASRISPRVLAAPRRLDGSRGARKGRREVTCAEDSWGRSSCSSLPLLRRPWRKAHRRLQMLAPGRTHVHDERHRPRHSGGVGGAHGAGRQR